MLSSIQRADRTSTVAPASLAPSSFRVTFACRVPQSLQSTATTGCGAVAGILHFSRQHRYRSVEDASEAYRGTHASPCDAVTSNGYHRMFGLGESEAVTPVLVDTNHLVGDHCDDTGNTGWADDSEYFRAPFSNAAALSRESSWILASPPHSNNNSVPITPGRISARLGGSSRTDLCSELDYADDALTSVGPHQSAAQVMLDFDVVSPGVHRRYTPLHGEDLLLR